MDIQPQNQQPISDDQELAKVLAGVSQQADEAQATPTVSEPVLEVPATLEMPVMPEMPAMPDLTPEQPVASEAPVYTPPTPTGSNELDSIKKDALSELRPLVDKLDVTPEEKFDTYLLLIRSTDDQTLVGPAHEAARNIVDEARRAQALLDVIKEIDYLSAPRAAAA